MPMRASSKPGTMRSLPMTSGKRSDAAPSTSTPSLRPSKRDDREVTLLDAPVLDGDEAGLLVAQLLHDGVHAGVVRLVDLGREREAGDSRPARRPVARAPSRGTRRRSPPRTTATPGPPAAPGHRRPPLARRPRRCAGRGARGHRRRWDRVPRGQPGRCPSRARASTAAPCPGGSRGRGCAVTDGGPPHRWRAAAAAALTSTSSTTVLRSAGVDVTFTVECSEGGSTWTFEYTDGRRSAARQARRSGCPRGTTASHGCELPSYTAPDAGVVERQTRWP